MKSIYKQKWEVPATQFRGVNIKTLDNDFVLSYISPTLARYIVRLHNARLKGKEEFCEWAYISSHDVFRVGCKSVLTYISKQVTGKSFKYCPYCGKIIKAKK